jgi:hypothetical protein
MLLTLPIQQAGACSLMCYNRLACTLATMKEKRSNIAAELLMQQTPETQLNLTAVVEAIREQTSRTGKKYHVLEFVDLSGNLRKVSVWDKKIIAALSPGQVIDLTRVKNDNWWNLGSSPTSILTSLRWPRLVPSGRPKWLERCCIINRLGSRGRIEISWTSYSSAPQGSRRIGR